MATTVSLKPNAVEISGSTSGTTTLQATAVAGTTTLTLPAATDTLVGKATTDTLTNKTLTTPSISSPTISDGTANGVAYLNGSKVLTTGSALVFDGTNFGLGVTPSAWNTNYKGFQVGAQASIVGFAGNYLWAGCNWVETATGPKYIGTGNATLYVQNAGLHAWSTSASGTAGNAITFTQAMTLDASGNLLVGTTSSGGKITAAVANNASFQTAASFTNATNADFNVRIKTSVTDIGCSTATPLTFSIANTEAARIDSSGNLLVGTTSVPTTARTKGFAAKSSSSGGISIYQTTNVSDWGITATSGSIVNFYSDTGSALTYAGSISVNGNVTTYGSVSDYRLKENIVPMTSALSKVQALNPVTFTFKDSGQTSQGFIAHELQTVIPDAVTGEKDAVDKDGNPKYQGVDTSFLVATLTAAIQEQSALITTLTARITALESA
jgi:hypothetical protein